MKVFAVLALAIAALVLSATSSTAGTARETAHHPRGLVPRVAHAQRFAAARRTIHAAGFGCVSACSSYESTINQYFTDVAADSGLTTNVYSVATQYSSIEYSETFGGSFVGGSPFPTKYGCLDHYDKYCVTNAQLETEIGKVIAKNNLPTLSQSPTALYFIFTPANVGICIDPGTSVGNACTTNAFCAYHNNNAKFLYAVEPDDAASLDDGCDTGEAPAGNGADDTLSTISHEQNESITDPLGDGWIADDGPAGAPQDEIGDLCAFDFGTSLGGADGQEYNQVINSHDYYLQLEYSNQDGGCAPYLGGPVTPPSILFPDGSGPLVLQSPTGSVLTTNTVYAIYWVPIAPANNRVPKIVGAATVGKKLKALHGAWSNALTYTYKWLRCSSAGTSCKAIRKATRSSYAVVPADAGHRLELHVTATNQAGHANAVSAPTKKVKP